MKRNSIFWQESKEMYKRMGVIIAFGLTPFVASRIIDYRMLEGSTLIVVSGFWIAIGAAVWGGYKAARE
ncbi:hypothetical protein KW796_02665 [Candidatus Parcubacteria bacterium]|nr:hypothetical protein [Candidatus Parcubacteria bacterium]